MMVVKTVRGKVYKLVGKWDTDLVFAPIGRKDDQVVIYTPSEVKELLEEGQFKEIESMVPFHEISGEA